MANEIATESEIIAALANASQNDECIPDLDEDTKTEVVPVVIPADQPEPLVDGEQQSRAEPQSIATLPGSSDSETQESVSSGVAAAAPTDGKQLLERFKKAKKSTGPTDATQIIASALSGEKSPPTAPPVKWAEWPSRAIPLIATIFGYLDRPFFWIPAQMRGALGYIAIITLVTSFVAGGVLPLLISRRDISDFIRERRAAAERPFAVVAASEPEHSDKAKEAPPAHDGGAKSPPNEKSAEKGGGKSAAGHDNKKPATDGKKAGKGAPH